MESVSSGVYVHTKGLCEMWNPKLVVIFNLNFYETRQRPLISELAIVYKHCPDTREFITQTVEL